MKEGIKKRLFIFLFLILLILMLPVAFGDVVINEIMYDPSATQGDDSDLEWIELFNNGTQTINLANFTINGNNFDDVNITVGGFVVIARELIDATDSDLDSFEAYYGNNDSVWNSTDGVYTAVDGTFVLGNSAPADIINLSNGSYTQLVNYTSFLSLAAGNGKTLIFYKNNWTESAFVNGTPGATNDQFAPDFNKWINPSTNNSFIKGSFNITVNITDVTNVSSALINFNNSNFSMSKNNDLWHYLWNTSLNSETKYNLTIFFNDSLGFYNRDTLFDITIDNTKPNISNPTTQANARSFISPRFVFNASVNAADTNLFNVTCLLNGTTYGYFTNISTSFICNLTAPLIEDNYQITFIAIDKANNTNTTTINFTTKYSTTATLTPQDITVSGLNQSSKAIEVNATLTNTGSSAIFDAGVIIDSFSSSALSATSVSYKSCSLNINSSQNCNATFNITIAGGTSAGNYKIFWNANWTNNNLTVKQLSQVVQSTVSIASTPQMTITQNVSTTINHGENSTLTLHINSTGNSALQDVNITFIQNTLQSNWLNITPKNFSSIAAASNATFNVVIIIPKFTGPGNYTGILNITASNIPHQTILLTTEVPIDNVWTSFPNKTITYRKSGDAGIAGSFTINNSGNIGHNFTFYPPTGNLFFYLWNDSNARNVYVERNQTQTVPIYHKSMDGNAPSTIGSFNLTITITSQNTSQTNTTSISLVRDDTSPSVIITSPSNNSFVKGLVEFNVSVAETNLSRLEYYINNSLVLNTLEINFTFRWNTANGSYSDEVYALKAIAYDSAGNSNFTQVSVTVNNTDNAPILISDIPQINITEDNDSITLNLSLFFKTIDGDSLKYNFTKPNNITVNVNNATQIASFAPAANFSGTNYIIFTAIDSSLNTTSSNNITITVTNVNDAPTIPSLTSPANNTNVKSATGRVTLTWSASIDADNDAITYFVFFSNNSLNISLNTTPVNATTASTILQFTELVNGTYFWNIIAGDSSLNASRTGTFQFNLNADTKPNIAFWQWNNTLIVSASDTTNNLTPIINENSTLAFKVLANDIDNDAISFTWFLNSSQKSTQQNFTFNFTNNLTSKGFYNITLLVQDNNSNENRQSWNLTITNLNRIPTITQIPNQSIIEESSNVTISLSSFFSDEDSDDTLTFIVVSQNTSQVNCSINGNNATLIGAGNFSGNGSTAARCVIVAFDGTVNSTNNTFYINASNINDAPVLTPIGSLTIPQGTLFYYDVNATDVDVYDTLTFSSNSTLFSINSSSGEFNFTSTNAQVGVYKINITVRDSSNAQNSEVVTLTISNINDAPVLDAISSKTATEDSELKFNVTAFDPDNNSLTFTSNISSILFTNAVNNSMATFSWISTNEHVGNNTVNITINDSSLTDSKTFVITVANTNDAPTITSFSPLDNRTIAENTGRQLFSVAYRDVDIGDTPTAAWYRNGTQISTSNSTNVTGLTAGIYNITVIVSDATNSTFYTWKLNVTSLVVSSQYTSPILNMNASQLQNVTNVAINQTTFGGIDFGNNTLNFSGVVDLDSVINISKNIVAIDTDNFPQLNKSAFIVMKGINFTKAPIININSGFRSVTGNVCPETICTNITYDASSKILRFIVSHFTVFTAVQNATNGAPTITSSPRLEAIEGSRYSYDVEATDPDNDALTFSLTTAPSGMSISSSSGLIAWTPSTSQIGQHNVTVSVSDSNLTDSQSFNITVSKGSRLRITDLDVKVDDETDKNLENGDRISKEAKPESSVEFKIKIENFFTREEDLEINDIETDVTIRDIDDGEDLDEDGKEFDLDAGDDQTVKVDFKVPLEVDDGDFDVEIHIEGEDSNGTTHTIDWTLTLEVEKERNDVRIIKSSLTPTLVDCRRTASLNAEIINLGRDDEEEVTLEILSPALGIAFRQDNIELEEGTDNNRYEKLLAINAGNVKAGIYPITINAYYENDKLDDAKTVELTVHDCEKKKEEKAPVKEEKPQQVEVVPPQAVVKEKPASVTEISFRETEGYALLLIIAFIIVAGLVVFAIGAMVIMMKKR